MRYNYKLNPVSLYDMAGLEGWLEEMAGQGLSPVRFGSYFTRFQEGGVPGTRYRLEPRDGREDPDPDQMLLYREAGWHYVGHVAKLYFVFAAQDPNAPELHTDPVTRGWSLEGLAQKIKKYYRYLLVYPLLMLLAIILPVLLSEWQIRRDLPWLEQPDMAVRMPLLWVNLSPILVFVPYLVWSWLRNLGKLRVLLRMQRELNEGYDAERPAPPTGSGWKWMNLVHLALYLLLALTLIGTQFCRLHHTPLEKTKLPYVSLTELEGEPLVPRSSFQDDNQTQRLFSLLAPQYYTVEQASYRPNGIFEPHSFSSDPEAIQYTYSPQLGMTRFRLLIPAMARPVAEAQMDSDRLLNLTWTYEEAEWPDADFVILARAKEKVWQMAALGRGGRVAVFRYAGKEDLADHLDLLAAMVAP